MWALFLIAAEMWVLFRAGHMITRMILKNKMATDGQITDAITRNETVELDNLFRDYPVANRGNAISQFSNWEHQAITMHQADLLRVILKWKGDWYRDYYNDGERAEWQVQFWYEINTTSLTESLLLTDMACFTENYNYLVNIFGVRYVVDYFHRERAATADDWVYFESDVEVLLKVAARVPQLFDFLADKNIYMKRPTLFLLASHGALAPEFMASFLRNIEDWLVEDNIRNFLRAVEAVVLGKELLSRDFLAYEATFFADRNKNPGDLEQGSPDAYWVGAKHAIYGNTKVPNLYQRIMNLAVVCYEQLELWKLNVQEFAYIKLKKDERDRVIRGALRGVPAAVKFQIFEFMLPKDDMRRTLATSKSRCPDCDKHVEPKSTPSLLERLFSRRVTGPSDY